MSSNCGLMSKLRSMSVFMLRKLASDQSLYVLNALSSVLSAKMCQASTAANVSYGAKMEP